uniref:FBA_2 domain-containing protein n=3 Tax=Caenorhabditis tropicalis TaxID=1561998 RepID=A0A1I7UMJ7_9PELO
MSSSPFTLFNLPYVPLSIILNTMNEMQIMKLALTSKRVYRLSKMLRKKRMERVSVCIGNYSTIRFETTDSIDHTLFRVSTLSEIQDDSRIEYLKIEDTVVQTQKEKDGRGCIHSYFEDIFIGIQTLSEIISDFFSVPIYRLSVTGDRNINDPRRAINWIMNRQETIAECSYHSKETSEEDLTYFLDTLRVTKSLDVFVKTSENFQYSFKYPMNLDYLHVQGRPYPWLTINNLIETNPRYSWMVETNFTSEDMRMLLILWILGWNPNLQTLEFRLKNLDLQTILNGVPAIYRETPEDLSYKWSDGEEEPRYFDYFFEIRNVNGAVASIVADNGPNEFFSLYVWPDRNGQQYPLERIV